MASKRGHPPLFELLRDDDQGVGRSAGQARSPQSTVATEPKPETKPEPPPPTQSVPDKAEPERANPEPKADAAPSPPIASPAPPKPAADPVPKPAPAPLPSSPERIPVEAKPRVRVSTGTPQASSKPDKPAEPPESPEVAAFASGTIELKLAHVYIGAAGVAIALILVWGLAYNIGASQKQQEMEARYSLDPNVPPIIEPLDQTITHSDPTAGPGVAQATPRREPQAATSGETRSRPDRQNSVVSTPPSQGLVLISTGRSTSDPRQPEFNYLELIGSAYAVPTEEAEQLIGYLAQNGLEAVGLPTVDQATGTVNNPPRYRISLLSGAVPVGQYGASASERQALEQRVAELGRVWSRQLGGSSNLSQPLWRKYSP